VKVFEEAFSRRYIVCIKPWHDPDGDTFMKAGDLKLRYSHFAPELFRRVRLKDPNEDESIAERVAATSENGSTQFIHAQPTMILIVVRVGQLQYEVVAYRLERRIQSGNVLRGVNVNTARWV